MRKNVLLLVLTCFLFISWKWQDLSFRLSTDSKKIHIKSEWVVDTFKQGALRANLINNSSPLIQGNFVVQGNAIDGLKAYNKKTGKLIWSFNISSGVASPLAFHKGNIYFGGADGFFYSVQLKTGLLNWKYFSASKNTSKPLIFDNTIYWRADNHKVYALDLKGKILWSYSGSFSSGDFLVKGSSRPAVLRNNLYVALGQGDLVALNRKTGQLKWKISFPQSITEDLNINAKCLFAPVLDSHLFCLNPSNGKTLWKLEGGSSVLQHEKADIYQVLKNYAYAFKNRKLLWKKQLKESYPFPPVFVKKYLIYAFYSRGSIDILYSKNGKSVESYKFGRGLSAPITVEGNDLYLFSVSAYLHKLRLNIQ